LELARKHGFAKVELSTGDDQFRAYLMRDPAPATAVAASPDSPTAEPTEPPLLSIKATLVGYYQESAKPLAVGATVRKGDIVAVIAALGLGNDVESTVAGEVVEVLVEPDQPVEFGQILAKVKAI